MSRFVILSAQLSCDERVERRYYSPIHFSQFAVRFGSMSTKAEIFRILIMYLFVKGSFFLPLAWVAYILNKNTDDSTQAS
jgi:hypothetical protein